jgi:polysaccharide biosynthesis protein PslG
MRWLPLVRTAGAVAAVAACLMASAATASHAAAPPLRGAATHPLWSDSTLAGNERELDMLVAAGANVVRIDLSWSSLQQGGRDDYAQWYVDKADEFFASARARGVRAIVTFWSTPCWASTAPDDVKQGCAGAWWNRGVERYPPADPADFARAAAWVAERWGADLAALEIWNEPNCYCFFRSSTPVADYAPLLKTSYEAVKRAAPGLPVLGASMLFSDGGFLDALYRQGVGGHMDGVSVRPFSQGRDPADPTMPAGGRMYSYLHGVPWLREVMVAHGDADKELWFTELGWSSCAPGGTSQWCVTQDQQARYIADALRIIRDRWDFVHAVSVYSLRNRGSSATDRETQMGLLHLDFVPKPSYGAFKDVLAELAASDSPPRLPLQGGSELQELGPFASAASTPAHTADVTAPVLTGLALRPRVLRGDRRRARLSFWLSEPAEVRLTIDKAGRRRSCGARCVRWSRLPGSRVHAGKAGANNLTFAATLRGRRLPARRYRLSAVARDPTGNASLVRRTVFRILP